MSCLSHTTPHPHTHTPTHTPIHKHKHQFTPFTHIHTYAIPISLSSSSFSLTMLFFLSYSLARQLSCPLNQCMVSPPTHTTSLALYESARSALADVALQVLRGHATLYLLRTYSPTYSVLSRSQFSFIALMRPLFAFSIAILHVYSRNSIAGSLFMHCFPGGPCCSYRHQNSKGLNRYFSLDVSISRLLSLASFTQLVLPKSLYSLRRVENNSGVAMSLVSPSQIHSITASFVAGTLVSIFKKSLYLKNCVTVLLIATY